VDRVKVAIPPAPAISVLTPCFQAERFIEECIESVAAQECSNVEHVIIDGGSTDRTVATLERMASRYRHVRWISEHDRGQSDALNKGVQMLRSPILGVLNVDDRYEPGVLGRIVELFKGLPEPSLVVGNCNVWDDAGTLIAVNRPRDLRLRALLFGAQYPWNPSSYFYHAALHASAGPYDVNDHYCMDLDFLLRAVRVASVHYHDEMWGNFHLHRGTKTHLSMQAGAHEPRKREVYRRHARRLGPAARIGQGVVWMLQAHPLLWRRIGWLRRLIRRLDW
jgi:glycosyltransferase involved in cell wall biosynthesis